MLFNKKDKKNYISFGLKEGERWDVDDILGDLKILVVQLTLTSHDYWETQRQFDTIIYEISKKSRGQEICSRVKEDNLNRTNEREASLGACKAFQIIVDGHVCNGTINERGGLKLIGDNFLKDGWTQKIIAYLKTLKHKGELQTG